jgi:hypothetical protein
MRDVGVGDRQDRGAAPGGGADRADAVLASDLDQRVAGEERGRCLATPIGPIPGAAAAVWDAEGLVQVEVADVRAQLARAHVADLRVQVGAIHVDLAAVLVDDGADVGDRRIRRRRASTGRSPSVRRACSRCSSAFLRRSWRSMLPSSSQATTTTRIPASRALAGLVPWAEAGIRQTSRCSCRRGSRGSADRQQPGVLALGAGVRLHRRGRIVARAFGEHALEIVEQFAIALCLLAGANGCSLPRSPAS